MLKILFLILTAIDGLAIRTLTEGAAPETASLAINWLFYFSCLPGWFIGGVAWKACRTEEGQGLQALRMMAANALVFAALASIFHFTQPVPPNAPGIYLFLLVYLFRVLPMAAVSVLVSPFIWVGTPRKGAALFTALLCQGAAWMGAYLVLAPQPEWPTAFLTFSLWFPNWGFAAMVGGLVISPLLSERSLPPSA